MVINCDSQYDAEAADNSVNDIAGQDFCFSFSFKLPPMSPDETRTVFAKAAGGVGYSCLAVGLLHSPYSNIQFYMYGDGYEDIFHMFTTGQYATADNQWHHGAIKIDRSHLDNDHCKFYLDGEDRGVVMQWDQIPSLVNADIFHVGSFTGGLYLNGKICDLKFLKGGLWTPTEIQYQFEHPWDYCPRAGAITEYWRLDEGKGTRLEGSDLHDLTLSDVAAWDRDGPLLPVTVGYGPEMAASTVVDNGITLTASTDNIHGSTLDIGANTRPQSVLVRLQVTIENQEGAPTDGYDADIRVQNSEDNSNWPDDGRGQPLGNFTADAAGADLTRSAAIEFVPKCRYARLELDNNNGTDDLVFTSRMAKITMQGK